MKLTLNRINQTDTYTEGLLYINGIYFCDTLEDKTRDLNRDGDLNDPGEEKVYGKTAIPFGKYDVDLTFSPKFKKIMPEVKAVLHFTGIRIHSGNNPEHTHGCILVGEKLSNGILYNSRITYERLMNELAASSKRGGGIKLEVI